MTQRLQIEEIECQKLRFVRQTTHLACEIREKIAKIFCSCHSNTSPSNNRHVRFVETSPAFGQTVAASYVQEDEHCRRRAAASQNAKMGKIQIFR